MNEDEDQLLDEMKASHEAFKKRNSFKPMKLMECFWDIETEAIPEAELKDMMPEFSAPSNYKDPAAIAKAVAEKRSQWMEDAALSAQTARVLCIGTREDGQFLCLEGPEDHILRSFWALWSCHTRTFIGFCTNQFDLPFLIHRSWKLGIPVPIKPYTRSWDVPNSLDLQDYWKCGSKSVSSGGLDSLAKFFGLPGKLGNGKDFATLYHMNRGAAFEYLERDVILLEQIAGRMGVRNQ